MMPDVKARLVELGFLDEFNGLCSREEPSNESYL